MTQQRGFIVFMGPIGLAGAALIGTIATVEYANDSHADQGKVAVTRPQEPVPVAVSSDYIGTSVDIPVYDGHRYRNGGHFGDKNSDEALENGDKQARTGSGSP